MNEALFDLARTTLLPSARAVVFDLDGTIIDSKGDIAAACNHALTSVDRAPLDPNVIASFVGDGARLLVARALAGYAPPDDAVVERCSRRSTGTTRTTPRFTRP